MRGTLRSECVSKDSPRQSTTCRRKILLRGRGRCGAVVRIWITPTSRYPVPARTNLHKIGEYPGPSQHLRPSAVVVDGTFFVHGTSNCGENKKGSPPCLGPSRPVCGMVSHRAINFSAHDMQMLNTTAAAVPSGMGPEMLERMERQNRTLTAYTFPQNR